MKKELQATPRFAPKSSSPGDGPVPVAIVGMGCCFPKAPNLEAYWANILNGVDAITEVPESHWRAEDYYDPDPKTPDKTYAMRGGFLTPVDFNPMEFGIAPNAIEATDTTQLLGMMVARDALRDAGYYQARHFDRARTGCIMGVTGTLELVLPLGARLGAPRWRRALKDAGVDDATAQDVVERIADSYVSWQEASFPGLLGNVVAGRIANYLDLGGTNCVVDAACASALSAIHMAVLELASGHADMMITGGMDTFNDIFMYMCFSKTPALSPTGDARPFDHRADGTILGEGLGALVLKRLEDAERDGDRIYAVIRSIGSSSDGKGQAIYAPSSDGQSKALRNAYDAIGIGPEAIDLLEAHGTGTKAGDAAEIGSLTRVFRKEDSERSWCALGAVKSQIGHTKAAAGAAGLIKVAMALHHKILPPTIKVERPADELAPGKTPFDVNTEARPWAPRTGQPRRAAVSSFGFGGSNFHCVLEEAESSEHGSGWDGGVQILPFAADSPDELIQQLKGFVLSESWEETRQEAARRRVEFRLDTQCRLLFVLSGGSGDFGKALAGAIARIESDPGAKSWSLPMGVWFGSGVAEGDLAVLFPGQGGTRVGMLRDLACCFPAMQEALAEADAAFGEGKNAKTEPRLSDLIYPHPAFDDATREANETALRATEVAQPAIGALSAGAMAVLRGFGIEPQGYAGHSYGELTALWASGRFDGDSLHALSCLRGRLMAEGNGDRGAMLAVRSNPETIEAILAETGLDLAIANRNAPTQTVLSGATDAVEKAVTLLAQRGIQATRLNVSAAFHSSFVSSASEPLLEALRRVRFAKSAKPVYGNTTGEAYPASGAKTRELLSAQLARPVEFERMIENMYAEGFRTFVEAGPGSTLTALAGAILGDRAGVAALALDASRGQRSGLFDLASLLAQLAALGHGVDLAAWDPDCRRVEQSTAAKKPVLTIPISGINYVKPKEPRVPRPPAVRAPEPAVPMAAAASPAPLPKVAAASLADSSALGHALRVSQENMIALQQIQEQTARLHQQYLEGQQAAQLSLQGLIMQQQGLVHSSLGLPTVPMTVSTPPASPMATPSPPSPAAQPAPLAEAQPAVPAPSEPSANTGKTVEVLLEVISDKTGYPSEMLDLSMGLDSDLGIDSIKRVEILSALQERLPEAPAIGPEHLGTLHTLGDIVEFLGETPGSEIAAPEAMQSARGIPSEAIVAALLEVVSEKTGYPVEMLDMDMGIDSDLGIDSIKRVEILAALQERLPQAPAIEPERLGSLQTLGQIVEFLSEAPSEPTHAPAVAPVSEERAKSLLLEIIADKTGYPAEMLDLEMGMDADLGIDSIKRVEILSALQERMPEAPPIGPEHLGTLHTLGQIVEFLACGQKAAESTSIVAPSRSFAQPAKSIPDQAVREPRAAIARSIPKWVDLSETVQREPLCLPEYSEVWIVGDSGDLAEELTYRLKECGLRPANLGMAEPSALSFPEELAGLMVLTPRSGCDDAFLHHAFRIVRGAASALRAAGSKGGAVLLTVSRMDGAFGFADMNGRSDPLSGGLAGLAKTAGHEWPEVACKALDLAVDMDDRAAEEAIIEEMFVVGPSEVGLSGASRTALELSPAELVGDAGEAPVAPGDVVVVTGGARGVTAEVSLALARAFQPTLALVGRSPLPEAEPEWLAGLEGEAEIKQALLREAGGKALPREIGERYAQIAAGREMRRNLERIAAAGGTVAYLQADVRDADALTEALARVRREYGPVRGLIHGAGVLADRRIEEKTDEQFDRVYGTKVQGLRNVLTAIGEDDLRFMALFSSSTGRFGRTGQVDYAMANEVLNKTAQEQARRRPNCRVVSVNWGPWAGGMVTPSLRGVFESEGIALIDLEAGAAYLIDELRRGPGVNGKVGERMPVEIVILGSASTAQASGKAKAVSLAASGVDLKPLPVAFEQEVSVAACPMLKSHVLDGKAVLPAAVSAEWLAHGALHANPGLRFLGFDVLRVLKGVTLEPDARYTVRIVTEKAERLDGDFVVATEMRGVPEGGGSEVLHASARMRLGNTMLPEEPRLSDLQLGSWPQGVDLYGDNALFHGPAFQIIKSVEGYSTEGIAALLLPAPAPADWLRTPLRGRWIACPPMLDAAFQMLILWSRQAMGAPSLPTGVRRYSQFQTQFPESGVRAVARVRSQSAHKAEADVEFLNRQSGALVARIEGYECVIDASLEAAFRRNRLA